MDKGEKGRKRGTPAPLGPSSFGVIQEKLASETEATTT